MKTRYEVMVDDRALSDIDPAIIVHDIGHDAQYEMRTVNNTGRDGQRVMERRLRVNRVTATVEIHEADTSKREEIAEKIRAWANSGTYIKTSDKKNMRLRATCERPAFVDSAMRWTRKMQVVFAAFDEPYWEAQQESSFQGEGSSISGKLYIPGCGVEARASALIANESDKDATNIRISVGDTRMEFPGMTLRAGDTLIVAYDDNNRMLNIMTIMDGRKMQYRSADSSDDLLVVTGKENNISITWTGGTMRGSVSARGLYL